MACYRQRLGEKIGNVEEARDKDDPEVALANAVSQPMKAHVQGLGHLQVDAVIGEADGDAEDWGWRLEMPHVGQNLALVCRDAPSSEEATILGLCYKGADDRYEG
jgi:hypothetical protein